MVIAPAKTLVGHAVPLCFNVFPDRVYLYALNDYLAWVQILDTQIGFQMESRDAAVCCDSQSGSICPSPGANRRLCNWQNPPPPHTITELPPCFKLGVIQRFADLSATLRRYLIQKFRTLIRQSTAPLASLWVPWLTEVFWHDFASSTVFFDSNSAI